MDLMIKSNTTYDILKKFAQVVLPALGTLYFALSQIWGLPYGEEIVGTIVALDAFLGVALSISSSNYHKDDSRFDGTIDIFDDGEKKQFNLELDDDPYHLEHKNEITFRVRKS